MHSSVIGKIEKANRYARETDRISMDRVSVTFRGDNDTHSVSLDAETWQCNCHYFQSWQTCAHILALQKVLGGMLPEGAQTSLFPAAPEGAPLAEPFPALPGGPLKGSTGRPRRPARLACLFQSTVMRA